jgi:hypothetical protein
VSTQQYKLAIESGDKLNTTAGFYLTSFPCYSQNSSEYYKTLPGQNFITLYCLEPPREIYLSYLTKKNGMFFAKNENMTGYMLCQVKIAGIGVNSVIPRLTVNVDECAKKELNARGNREILTRGVSGAGKTVSEVLAKENADKQGGSDPAAPKPMEVYYENQGGTGSIPYIDGDKE